MEGVSCVSWDHPDIPPTNTTDMHGNDGLYRERHNYCRNPTRTGGAPWCYVEIEGEYMQKDCDVPFCGEFSYWLTL